ncbi:DsbA family protein [Pokkaliibacter sp. CJK22405]|uniref:DsbA family protein n=1 Tax=Pokkaliibacter sp. CJK22405 TaxID=3384615 RepID=UPI003984A79A
MSDIHVAPLTWGTGKQTFEMFLEPTCPFSNKAFNKLDSFLAEAGEDQVTVTIHLQSQPWHMYSSVIVRCILAAASLPEGREAARKVLQAVADHREEFEFEDHCRGANMDTTPQQIIQRIEDYSGVRLAKAFDNPALQKAIKRHAKYGRQNGIHVSPTFMVNGLTTTLGSGDSISTWVQALSA